MRLAFCMLSVIALTGVPISAQWLNYPTGGVPRLPDGKPNLAAPVPRSTDGKPDLPGLWEPDLSDGTATIFNPNAVFPPEWRDIGAQLKTGLPFRPWARDLRNVRQAANSKDSPDGKCLPMGPLMDHSNRSPRKIVHVPGLVVILYEKSLRTARFSPTGDTYRWIRNLPLRAILLETGMAIYSWSKLLG